MGYKYDIHLRIGREIGDIDGKPFVAPFLTNTLEDVIFPNPVVEGMNVVDKISQVQTGGNDRPLNDIVIVKATILK